MNLEQDLNWILCQFLHNLKLLFRNCGREQGHLHIWFEVLIKDVIYRFLVGFAENLIDFVNDHRLEVVKSEPILVGHV